MVNLWWNAGETWWENRLNSQAKNMPLFLDLFLGFPVLGKWVGGGIWLVRFGGLFLGENLIVGAGRGQVAAVEVDCVGAEAALERQWQGVLILVEP